MFSEKCSLRKLFLHWRVDMLITLRSTFQILFYALRPTFVRSQRLTRWHILNIIAQALFDYTLVRFFGSNPLTYLIASSFFAGSLHPCAGHFIAEHYLWDGMEQETFSYYGWLNVLAYNVRFLPSHNGFQVKC
jgi:sphingolipid 4-desaturase/C4-monooxygenase